MTSSNATDYVDNFTTFCSFSFGLERYKNTPPIIWKPRLFSAYLANQFMPEITLFEGQLLIDKEKFERGVGSWSAMWFFFSCVLLIFCFKKHSPLFMFGLFAAISFGYEYAYAPMVYPWDMATIFFAVVFIVLIETNRLSWLLLILPIAVGFKETTMVLTISLLFWNKVSFRKRLTLFILAAFFCVLVKYLIGYMLDLPSAFFTMDGTRGDGDGFRIFQNIRYLLNVSNYYFFAINAGTLLAFLILPTKKYPIIMLKSITAIFLVGLFMSGNIIEYRIFFDLIPISLYGLYLYFLTNQDNSCPA